VPVEGISASFVTVTKTLSKVVEFPGGAAVVGDEVANVVPAGKLGADAMETLTVAGPDVPGEVILPPPPPQAARAAEIISVKTIKVTFRNVRSVVLMALSSFFHVRSLLFLRSAHFAVRKVAIRVSTEKLC